MLEPRRTLLDALRSELLLTGTKTVCDMGDGGAYRVLVDGRAMYACLLLAVECHGRRITTIEELGHDGQLGPIHQAFLEGAFGLECYERAAEVLGWRTYRRPQWSGPKRRGIGMAAHD